MSNYKYIKDGLEEVIIGPKGDKGETGPKGEKGDIGPKGEAGKAGPPGDKGETGPPGLKGEMGPTGLKGLKGLKGEMGPPGEMGPMGTRGPRGDKGNTGLKGKNGVDGIKGPSGHTIISPSEIILSRIGKYIKDNNIICYIDAQNIENPSISQIGNFNIRGRIIDINLGLIKQANNNIYIPIKNIESINAVFEDEDSFNMALPNIEEIINMFYVYNKKSPDVVDLDENGQPFLTGDNTVDYGYEVRCSCKNSTSPNAITAENMGKNLGKCICRGEKIDIFRYRGYKTEYLSKAIQIENNKGKVLERITTSKINFTDLTGISTPLNINSISPGAAVLTYRKFNNRYRVISIVNLEKVMSIKFRS